MKNKSLHVVIRMINSLNLRKMCDILTCFGYLDLKWHIGIWGFCSKHTVTLSWSDSFSCSCKLPFKFSFSPLTWSSSLPSSLFSFSLASISPCRNKTTLCLITKFNFLCGTKSQCVDYHWHVEINEISRPSSRRRLAAPSRELSSRFRFHPFSEPALSAVQPWRGRSVRAAPGFIKHIKSI